MDMGDEEAHPRMPLGADGCEFMALGEEGLGRTKNFARGHRISKQRIASREEEKDQRNIDLS
jgi:hypothetical protein